VENETASSPAIASVEIKTMLMGASCRAFSSAAVAASERQEDSATAPGPTTPFLLADIGEGIKEVELLQWFVEPGDTVRQFDKICEVQSDKATVEITSRFDGIVERLSGEVGSMIQVGEPLLFLTIAGGVGAGNSDETSDDDFLGGSSSVMLSDDEDHPDPDDRLRIPTVASHYHLQSDHEEGYVDSDIDEGEKPYSIDELNKFKASPAVRKLGKEYKLNLSTIHPSGPHGRLLKSDVVTYLKEQGLWRGPADEERGSGSRVSLQTDASVRDTARVSSAADFSGATNDYEVVQMKGYHRLMVQTMTEALKIPHMGFSDELIINQLVKCRQELRASVDMNVSFLAFFIKATSLALAEYPMINSLVHDADKCEIQVHRNHHIGIAVDTPRGLVVPVIRRAQEKSLLEIQEDLNILKEKALDSKLSKEDLELATFTLSNIGTIGGQYMQPVILPPQLGMGAFGRVQRVPRFVNDEVGSTSNDIVEAQVLHVSWAGDHRFLDGATLARFHASFKRYVENPSQMLVHMK